MRNGDKIYCPRPVKLAADGQFSATGTFLFWGFIFYGNPKRWDSLVISAFGFTEDTVLQQKKG